MTNEEKKEFINQYIASLKKIEHVSNVKSTSNDLNYEVHFNLCGNIMGTIILRKSGDIALIKMEGVYSQNDENVSLDVLSKEIATAHEAGFDYTLINDSVTFSTVMALGDNADLLYDDVDYCAKLIIRNILEKIDEFEHDQDTTVFEDPVQKQDIDSESAEAKSDNFDISDISIPDPEDLDDILEEKSSYIKPGYNKENITSSQEVHEQIEDTVTSFDIDDTGINGIMDEDENDLYNELNRVFDEKKKLADSREQTLNEFAARLKEKEKQLEEQKKEAKTHLESEKYEMQLEVQREKDAMRKEFHDKEVELAIKVKKATDDRKRLDFELKKIQVEKETLKTKFANIEEREMLINSGNISSGKDSSTLSNEIDKLNEQIAGITEENDKIRSSYTECKKHIQTAKKELQHREQIIGNLKELIKKQKSELEQMQQAVSVKADQDATTGDDTKLKDMQAEIDKKNNEIEELNSKISLLDEEKANYIQLYNEAKEKISTSDNTPTEELSEEDELRIAINNIKQEAEKIGIHTDLVPSNGDVILAGEKDGCTLCINVNAKIIYCEKSVKKPQKYMPIAEAWTQEDIRVSYAVLTGTGKFMVKYVYTDVAKAIFDIMERFKTIS